MAMLNESKSKFEKILSVANTCKMPMATWLYDYAELIKNTLQCEECGTQFVLKPLKGELVDEPICPACGSDHVFEVVSP